MRGSVVIDDVRPRTPGASHPAKAVAGRPITVSADVYRDGHDVLAARVLWRAAGTAKWSEAAMAAIANDRWAAVVEPQALGLHEVIVEAWTDAPATWRRNVVVKLDAGEDVDVEMEEGARLLEARLRRLHREDRDLARAAIAALRDASMLPTERLSPAMDERLVTALDQLPGADATRSRRFSIWVDRERALVGAWYELFPRSHGGLAGTAERLEAVAAMGFDVAYLPPVHPIGTTFRKGRDNALTAAPDDPGSPWAIGGPAGGHDAVDPALGTLGDFDALVRRADELGLEIAMDYALQCSADHPWLREHPEWFHHRPDGSIRYAENPPKKYQDIYPLNFWPERDADREALWSACEDILEHWVAHGIRLFRVDNPHTKPFAFWEWLIPRVQARHPDVIFLAEAFTRPKPMAKLAEIGFSQSYTYFTWRTSKQELIDYVAEVALGPKADYMRPNFWPNTPDILSGPLRRGGPGAFKQRLVLAATLSPSYGIYSGYELCENEPFSEGNEEYLHSEKYEIKHRDFDAPGNLAPFVTLVNGARRRHPALSELTNVRFHHAGSDAILAYSKHTADRSDVVLVVVNLDPFAAHEDTLWIDLDELGLPWNAPYEAHDEITGATWVWQGPSPYVRLEPEEPAHVLHLRALR